MKSFLKFLYTLVVTVLIALILVIAVGGPDLAGRLRTGVSELKSEVTEELTTLGNTLMGGVSSAAQSAPDSSSQASGQAAPVQAGWGATGMDGVTVYQYGRSLLGTDEERSAYDKIAAAVLNHQSTLTADSSMEPVVMEKVYKYYVADHTENFYLRDSSMEYRYLDSKSGRKYESYTFTFSYQYDSNTAAAMKSQMGKAIRDMLAQAKGGTEEAKERSLHDALVGAVHYDLSAESAGGDSPSYTAYGALVNGTAVCDGYAKAMKLLLDSAGIKSLYVSGTAANSDGSGPHAWNMALVGGKWYYLDATFDDPLFYNSKGQYVNKNVIDHTYFNYKGDSAHVLGTFDAGNPFSDSSENYAVMPVAG